MKRTGWHGSRRLLACVILLFVISNLAYSEPLKFSSQIKYPNEGAISLQLSNIPLKQLLNTLAEQGKINLIYDEAVPLTKVIPSINVKNLSFPKVFESVLQTNNLAILQMDLASFIILPVNKIQQYVESNWQIYDVHFVKVSKILSLLQGVYQTSVLGQASLVKFIADESQNAIIIIGPNEKLGEITEFIKKLDKKSAQVMVEMKIVEASKQKEKQYGIELNEYQFSTTKLLPEESFRRVSYNDFPAYIKYLQSTSDVKLLANPNVLAIDNQKAVISIADQIAIPISTTQISSGVQTGGTPTSVTTTQTQFFDIGIKLSFTPSIHTKDEVTIELNAEVSSLGKIGTAGIPDIGKRNVQTYIRLKNGETTILGGLKREEQRTTHKGIPILSDIPLIGALFRSTTDQTIEVEIILSITPHIISPE